MKKLLLALGLLACFGATEAKAAGRTPTFEVGYSTFSSYGAICTTGTVVNISTTPYAPSVAAGDVKGPWAGVLIQNQDSSDTVWFGNEDTNATTGSGLKLGPDEEWVVYLGRHKDNTGSLVPLYCEADSAAGTAGVQLFLMWFGY